MPIVIPSAAVTRNPAYTRGGARGHAPGPHRAKACTEGEAESDGAAQGQTSLLPRVLYTAGKLNRA